MTPDSPAAPYITEDRFMRLEEIALGTSTQVAEHGVMLATMSQQVHDLKEQVSEKIDAAFSRVIEKMDAQERANIDRLERQEKEHFLLAEQVDETESKVDRIVTIENGREQEKKKNDEEHKSKRAFRREKILIPIGMLAAGAFLKPMFDALSTAFPIILKLLIGG